MRQLSILIPSKTARNFLTCAEAVRRHEPEVPILLVNDGIPDVEALLRPELMPCRSVPGVKPFSFARNVNIGIRAAEEDDILLLNDDALLRTPFGFTLLQKTAEAYPEWGVIAATTNSVGNPHQLPKGLGLRREPRMVCFVAVLIPRATIDRVGELDERFGAPGCYGFEDDDFCLRVRQAGLQIGIHDGCFVDHASLPSSFRGHPGTPADVACFDGGRRLFLQKWGAHPL